MSDSLGQVVFAFFEDHLKVQKGLRPGSIKSYRDTLKLFLIHVAGLCHRPMTRLALSDLDDSSAFIARDSPRLAAMFVERIFGAAERLQQFPRSGRLVVEARDEAFREVLVLNHRVIYVILESEVEILAIIHGARELRLDDLND